ncbi:MAG: hypothetical protein DRJ61_03945 [Acidobacteria bacterium]|nr:MAG: hypothetical protein DRJ61_03945 [Acidobacteriota bacterium]
MSEATPYPLGSLAKSLIDGPFGSNLKSEHYVTEPGVRVVRLNNVKEGRYDDTDRVFVSDSHADSLARHDVRPGDVLIAALGDENHPVGRACCYPCELPPAINKVDCFRLRCNPDLAANRYVMYSLNTESVRDHLRRYEQGVTRKRINLGNLARVEINLPDLSKQDRIAEILSTVDDAIEQTERLIAKTQNLKAGLMHDLFTRGVLPDGRLRPPRQEAPELYQESVLGWIPVGWGVKPIGQVFDVQLGKMLSKKSKTGKMSAPYVGNRAVQWDRVDVAALEEMDFSDSERKKYLLAPKDLLVCEGGEVGRTAMWRGEMEECYFQKAIHRLRPKDARVIPEYMLRFMRFGDTAGIFRMFTSQSSIAHLTREKLCAVQMPLPSEPEQRQIAGIFDAVDEDLFGQGATRNFLGGVKRGLMHDLLTGRCLGRKRDVYL